jgi:hypothetical protein
MWTFCVSIISAQGIPPTEIPGDFNRDEIVNMVDFGVISENWLKTLPWGPWNCAPPKLIAHYRLDGDATDSGDDNDGVIHGTPVWVSGKNTAVGSGAIQFHSGDYISVSDNSVFDITGSFTVAVWIRINTTPGAATVISKGDSAWKLVVDNDGHLIFSCTGLDGNSQITGHTNVADNNWHHVAGVYDQDIGEISLYIDGSKDASISASGQIDVNDWDVWIGGNAEVSGQWLNGFIDNVRLYNYALTSQQIFNRMTWHVDTVHGRDTYNGQGKGRAFQTIQKAIDMASDGDEILVWPGVYTEAIIFMGKAVTVRSAADAAVIEAPGNFAVNFYFGEQAGSVIQNFIIANSEIAIFVESSRPTIRNVTVVNNDYGLEAYTGSKPVVRDSIFWNNKYKDIYNDTYAPQVTYSCIQRFVQGEGNISTDPLFAAVANGDYHLKSEMGRFVADGQPGNSGEGGGYWVYDDQTSPCIDAADPALNPMGEMMPNGARVNMGAHGATAQASRSPWPLKSDENHDGIVNIDDLMVLVENWLYNSQGN